MYWEMWSPGAAKHENITFSCHLKVGDLTFMTHSIASVWWVVVGLMFESWAGISLGWCLNLHPSRMILRWQKTHLSHSEQGYRTKSYLIVVCAGISSKAKPFLEGGENHFISHYLGIYCFNWHARLSWQETAR